MQPPRMPPSLGGVAMSGPEHEPFRQLCPDGQALLQKPQLKRSLEVSTQPLGQQLWPVVQ